MSELLDIDEPEEVIAAAGRVASASAAVTDQMIAVARGLVPAGSASSGLDCALMNSAQSVRSSLTYAATSDSDRAVAVHRYVVGAVQALVATDDSGRTLIDHSGESA
ncbi:hypothetical protein [Nocardia sp. NBC_01327]|uniref:hypothetical protein n=1 Tax=Nocardia sp. NBC_01327 TaxID=2903593 RepID=UPI002E0F294F|nr:hypothetical protein OG326_41780 [Nocardia sp. NBC_01327]